MNPRPARVTIAAVRPHVEKVTPPDGASFRVLAGRRDRFPFDWHHHPEAELTLVARSRGRRFVGDSAEDYADGDLVLLGPALPHTWASDSAGPQECVVVQYDPAWLARLAAVAPEAAGAHRATARAWRGLQFAGDARDRAADRLLALADDAASPLDRLAGLLAVLDGLADADARPLSGEAFARRPPVVDARLADVLRYVERNLTGGVSASAAAGVACLTPAAFSRFFRRATGRTFVAHVHDARVALACRRLLETDDAVTAVALASGFDNLSNFNRVFRRLRGRSPRDFRRAFGA